MKVPFYNAWFQKRLKKVVDILGEDWFVGKSILELGACHGDFGLEFIKMGSRVTFCEARIEHLESINKKLCNQFPDINGINKDSFAKLVQLDQNYPYVFDYKYDLVLHFGLLIHIENWKKDLECALKTSDLMFLETTVYPNTNGVKNSNFSYEYGPYNSMQAVFSEDEVEQVLSNCGAKFIRFDSKDLNNSGWSSHKCILNNVYDWNMYNYEMYYPNNKKDHVNFKRFWLVLK